MACVSAITVVSLCLAMLSAPVAADAPQGDAAPGDPDTAIQAAPDKHADAQIQQRTAGIFRQIESLAQLNVAVSEGVATLSGPVANDKHAQRAIGLAKRVQGVVTVEDNIERTLAVEDNVTPVIDQFRDDLDRLAAALPLIMLALVLFAAAVFGGWRIAAWSALWQHLSPNSFLADLLAQAVKILAVVLGLVVALNLLGATALLGTVLGGAGVLGIAVGFAVRDSMENFISSIMLSIRQPFRANDHVVINAHEGIVMRLTSRATVLMTLDGNHLRIPNSTVFKAVILNYTRNPERRFDFALGIGADDDPLAAMKVGLDAMRALAFPLAQPQPVALIETVGDSNIVLTFMAWINQQQTDFVKARSLAISAAKNALEAQGFTLPEPIYRLRFDQSETQLPGSATPPADRPAAPRKTPAAVVLDRNEAVLDVRPDTRLAEKVEAEREQEDDSNLLDNSRPVE